MPPAHRTVAGNADGLTFTSCGSDGAGWRPSRSRRRPRPPPSPVASSPAAARPRQRDARISQAPGVVPVLALKRRRNVRRLMPASRASPAMRRIAGGFGAHALQHLAEPPPFPRLRHRCLDELRLSAVAMRRHHEAPRHAVGRRRSPVAADEMQAEVDAGRAARRREQAALVDIEHVRHHADARVGAGQPLAVAPVRGRPLAVQQPGRRQHEHARAERQQPRASLVRPSQAPRQPLPAPAPPRPASPAR